MTRCICGYYHMAYPSLPQRTECARQWLDARQLSLADRKFIADARARHIARKSNGLDATR